MMTSSEAAQRASSLPTPAELIAGHAAGETWTAMAVRLGCSTTTLRKSAFPEKREAYNGVKRTQKQDPVERRKQDLKRLDARRDNCMRCGVHVAAVARSGGQGSAKTASAPRPSTAG